jgi:hypothetical protein
MKLLMFINLFFFGYPVEDKGPDTLVSCHFREISFIEFCDHIYHESGVRIYFQSSQVQRVKVSMDTDTISIIAAVEMALKGTGLEVSEWNDDLVVMPGEKLPPGLPPFMMQQLQSDRSPPAARTLTQSEEH